MNYDIFVPQVAIIDDDQEIINAIKALLEIGFLVFQLVLSTTQ